MKKRALFFILLLFIISHAKAQFNSWINKADSLVYSFEGPTLATALNYRETMNVANFIETVSNSTLGWLPAPNNAKGYLRITRNTGTPNNSRFDLLPASKPYNSLKVRIPYGGVTKLSILDIQNATNVCRASLNVKLGNVINPKGSLRIGLGSFDSLTQTEGSFNNAGPYQSGFTGDIFSVLVLEPVDSTNYDLKIRIVSPNGANTTYRLLKEKAFTINGDYDIEMFANNSLHHKKYIYSNDTVSLASGSSHIYINGDQIIYDGKVNFPSAILGGPELEVQKNLNAFGFQFTGGDTDTTKSTQVTISNIKINYAQDISPIYTGPKYVYSKFSTDGVDFYNKLDSNLVGLSALRSAVSSSNFQLAAQELRNYFLAKKSTIQAIFKVKDLSPIETNIHKTGVEYLLQKIYTFQGVTHTFSNGEVDWLYNPTGINGIEFNQEWPINTCRFRYLPTIVDAYRDTKEERFAAEAINLMLDFITKYPVPSDKIRASGTPSEFDSAMYSQLSTAVRIDNMVYALFSVIESPNLSDEYFVLIMQSIYNHLLRMEKYPYLGFHNMGVIDAKTIHKVAISFPEFIKSAEWADWGMERALDQMEGVVYPDGVEKELCPSYHRVVMNDFLEFVDNCNLAGVTVPVLFKESLDRMAEFLVKISRPDGSLPAFNELVQRVGNGSVIRASVGSIANGTGNTGVLKWFAENGTLGTAPSYNSVALDWAGYYVMRSGWNVNDNYMVVKAGPYGLAHQQEDKLSFEFFSKGELFLVDPGFYTYNKQSPWRKYYLSSLAHNTLIPDGLSQYRFGRTSLYENLTVNDATWISNSKYDYLSAVYNNGYADHQYIYGTNPNPLLEISHQRDVVFIKPGLWLMLDWANPSDAVAHKYEALFQSQKGIDTTANSFIINGINSNLHIFPFSTNTVSLSKSVVAGQETPFKRGNIFDNDAQENIPLPTAVVTQNTVGNTVQAYFIIPSDKSLIVSHTVDTFNVNGGIGARLVTSDGLDLTFIAQRNSGAEINGGGLTTNGKLKIKIVGDPDSIEVGNTPDSVLSRFLNLDISKKSNGVELSWEGDVKKSIANTYHVLRSQDGITFRSLSTITSGKSTTYSYLDSKPHSGSNYYKIKYTDLDGKEIFSNVRNVSLKFNDDKFSIYKKENSSLAVRVYSETSGNALVSVSDLNGKIILEENIWLEKGENNIDLLSKVVIPQGIYIGSLQYLNNITKTKFVF